MLVQETDQGDQAGPSAGPAPEPPAGATCGPATGGPVTGGGEGPTSGPAAAEVGAQTDFAYPPPEEDVDDVDWNAVDPAVTEPAVPTFMASLPVYDQVPLVTLRERRWLWNLLGSDSSGSAGASNVPPQADDVQPQADNVPADGSADDGMAAVQTSSSSDDNHPRKGLHKTEDSSSAADEPPPNKVPHGSVGHGLLSRRRPPSNLQKEEVEDEADNGQPQAADDDDEERPALPMYPPNATLLDEDARPRLWRTVQGTSSTNVANALTCLAALLRVSPAQVCLISSAISAYAS